MTTEAPQVTEGTVAPGFEGVRAAFAVAVHQDPGAQLAAYVDGRLVVDLWSAAAGSGDTLTALYSTGKGAAHLAVALLVQDGVLDLDEPVAASWPEFAAHGKGTLSLRDLMAHRAGLIGIDRGFTADELVDDAAIARLLAAQRPYWEPGTAYGYHAYVVGALTGEVVRRATGRSLVDVIDDRLRVPRGIDLWFGLPDADDARFVAPRPGPPRPDVAPPDLMRIAFNLQTSPPTDIVAFGGSPALRRGRQTSAGLVGTARGVAAMYAAAIGVDGTAPLLTSETAALVARPTSRGEDVVTGDIDAFALGFETIGRRFPFLGADAFGHSGAAGALGFAAPVPWRGVRLQPPGVLGAGKRGRRAGGPGTSPRRRRRLTLLTGPGPLARQAAPILGWRAAHLRREPRVSGPCCGRTRTRGGP